MPMKVYIVFMGRHDLICKIFVRFMSRFLYVIHVAHNSEEVSRAYRRSSERHWILPSPYSIEYFIWIMEFAEAYSYSILWYET